jgi:hypothetical protein
MRTGEIEAIGAQILAIGIGEGHREIRKALAVVAPWKVRQQIKHCQGYAS